jgi:hypothetical protein
MSKGNLNAYSPESIEMDCRMKKVNLGMAFAAGRPSVNGNIHQKFPACAHEVCSRIGLSLTRPGKLSWVAVRWFDGAQK